MISVQFSMHDLRVCLVWGLVWGVCGGKNTIFFYETFRVFSRLSRFGLADHAELAEDRSEARLCMKRDFFFTIFGKVSSLMRDEWRVGWVVNTRLSGFSRDFPGFDLGGSQRGHEGERGVSE